MEQLAHLYGQSDTFLQASDSYGSMFFPPFPMAHTFGKCLHHLRQGTIKRKTFLSTRQNIFNQQQLHRSTEWLRVPWQRTKKNGGRECSKLSRTMEGSELFQYVFGAHNLRDHFEIYIVKKRNTSLKWRAHYDVIIVSTCPSNVTI